MAARDSEPKVFAYDSDRVRIDAVAQNPVFGSDNSRRDKQLRSGLKAYVSSQLKNHKKAAAKEAPSGQ